MFHNKLKQKLKNGEAALGMFITCDSPDLVEIVGLTGFDFVILDTEHGPLSVETTQDLIRAAELRGLTPITRVTENTETTILRSLDVGTHGIQVPQVNDKTIAEGIVNSAKYFPSGNRGLALARSANFGLMNPMEYFEKSNEETLIVAHCENKKGLDNLEEIVKVPEIDVIFLGPFDMSQSLGIPGQIQHPKIEEAAEKVLRLSKEAGKAAGIFVPNGEQAKLRIQQGFQYVAIGLDISLFSNACINELKIAKE